MSDAIETPPAVRAPRTKRQIVLPPAPKAADQTILDVIARAAADPQVDVEKMERLMLLYERHMAREAHAQYTAALAEMQPELPEIAEHGAITGRDGQVQSTYALWEDVQRSIKPILARHGFALTFAIGQDGASLSVTAKLSHKGGHVEDTTMVLPVDTSGSKNTVQAHGSSTSYGMRYTARALLNLTSRGEDDDGQAGGTKLISAGELEALQLLATKAGADLRRYCQHLKIGSLDQLPAARLRMAERLLQDKIARDAAAIGKDPAA